MKRGANLVKSPAEIALARAAGALAADVLRMIAPHVRPGVTTDELDRLCHDHIVEVQKATPGLTCGAIMRSTSAASAPAARASAISAGDLTRLAPRFIVRPFESPCRP